MAGKSHLDANEVGVYITGDSFEASKNPELFDSGDEVMRR
jgi:hypothetical protein